MKPTLKSAREGLLRTIQIWARIRGKSKGQPGWEETSNHIAVLEVFGTEYLGLTCKSIRDAKAKGAGEAKVHLKSKEVTVR